MKHWLKKRVKAGRTESPSYGIIDSQSVKTIYASEERGIDGGKLVKGRKRHIVVDIMGNLLSIAVHAADIHDTKSGINPAKKAFEKYPTIKKFCGDEGYRKSFEEDIQSEFGLSVDISEKIKQGWTVIAKRWIAERTFAWRGYSRRLSKNYEISTHSAESICKIFHIHTLLHSLTKGLNTASKCGIIE